MKKGAELTVPAPFYTLLAIEFPRTLLLGSSLNKGIGPGLSVGSSLLWPGNTLRFGLREKRRE